MPESPTVLVRGYYVTPDGSGSGRRIRATATATTLTNVTEHEWIRALTVVAMPAVDDGYFELELVPTNHPDLTPFQWVIESNHGPTFTIEIPHDAPGGQIWLTDAATTEPPPDLLTYYTAEQTRAYVDNAIEGIEGSGSAVTSVNTRTGAVVGLAEQASLTTHTGDTNNPHVVTKSQVGLGNVDNTSDAGKPVSTATQTALDAKASTASLAPVATSGAYGDLTGRPTIPAAFADLTGQASDVQIPAAIARDAEVTSALTGKQDLDADLTAFAALTPANDDVVQRKAGAWTNRTMAQIKADLALIKGDVGLGNVDNTSDANKPVSAAMYALLGGGSPLAAGESVFPRELLSGGNSATAATQQLRLTFFTALKSETTTQVRVASGGTAAGATPTLCRLGLYLIDASDNGTLVAATANDTALWAAASTWYTRSWSTPYDKIAGQRYALGQLIVTAAALPSWIISAAYQSVAHAEVNFAPRLVGQLSAQTDLPSSFTNASLTSSANRHYGAILP